MEHDPRKHGETDSGTPGRHRKPDEEANTIQLVIAPTWPPHGDTHPSRDVPRAAATWGEPCGGCERLTAELQRRIDAAFTQGEDMARLAGDNQRLQQLVGDVDVTEEWVSVSRSEAIRQADYLHGELGRYIEATVGLRAQVVDLRRELTEARANLAAVARLAADAIEGER